jgi:hypothetical protein
VGYKNRRAGRGEDKAEDKKRKRKNMKKTDGKKKK